MNILSYLNKMMEATDGSPSSKRWIAMIAAFLMFGGFIANLFWGLVVEQFMYDSMVLIVIGSLGITGAEKFAPYIAAQRGKAEES
jgi:uncharacterized membrane protein YphA (DoxX/SURF4 family)